MSQLNVPSWLCGSYFQEILAKNYKNSSIKVQKIKVEPCGAANDGFLSTLLRVRVDYCMNSTVASESFILKMPTSQELAVEKVGANGYDVQNKEMSFFETVAPQMEKILKKIGEDKNVIPKVIAIDRTRDVIVLEDLSEMNFLMADRLTGLNEVQIDLALKKLAKFHAASLVIHRKHPKAFDSFDVGFFSRKVTAFHDGLLSLYELVVEEIETWPGFEKLATKMKIIRNSLIESASRCFDVADDDFCVLNHGDLWTNNLMYVDDDAGSVVDAILVRISFKSQEVF